MKFPLNRPRDTVPAMLRPGEGVLVPEATAEMGGRQGINAMNRGAEARRRMLSRGKKPVQHFAFGGVSAPVLQGGPSFDPRMPQRGMPPAPAFRAPAPVQGPYPVGVGGGTEPGPFTMPPPVLRQPMAMPQHVPHFQKGGVIHPELADERVNPDTNWFYDPREKEFDPETELKYQFRDKLGKPTPVQHFQAGGSVEPPELNQWQDFQGSYYPPDWMGPDSGPKPPYYGYYGGTDQNPQHSWSPYDETGWRGGSRNFMEGGDNSRRNDNYNYIDWEGNRKWLDRYLDNPDMHQNLHDIFNSYKQRAGGGGGDRPNWGDLGNLPTSNLSQRPGGMFSGLPGGFTEGNRGYGDGPSNFTQTGGAPTFQGPGFTGPSWSPGGSIFGGRTNLSVAGGGNIGDLGGAGPVNASALGGAIKAPWYYNGPNAAGINGHSTDSPEGLGMLRYTPEQHAQLQMALRGRSTSTGTGSQSLHAGQRQNQ